MHDTDVKAAVRASLDAALGDLLRTAVEVGPEPYAVSCARIHAAFDRQMVPYCHLGWAMDEAATLKRGLEQGLRPYRSEDEGSKAQRL